MTQFLHRFAFLTTALVVSASPSLSAQTPAPVKVTFDLTLKVPVQLSDLHPEITFFNLLCSVQPVGATGSDGLATNTNVMGDNISQGMYKGTREGHFTVTSQHGYAPGQQWKYSCYILLLKPSDDGTGNSAMGTPGYDTWALIASGSPKVEGTFTTQ